MSKIEVDKVDPQSGTALEIGTSGDTITVPTGAGLTVTDEVKTNKISPATGTAFALGDSGDTFTVPSGATIVNSGTATGFGAIAWQSVTTGTTLTAVAGRGYPINTTSNACTVTLPASASVGDQIIFTDYNRNWGTNAVTLDINSLKFQKGDIDAVYETSGETVHIVYIDATVGWVPLFDGEVIDKASVATGGTETSYSGYKVHTFLTSTENFVVTAETQMDIMIIAGGGGGGGWHSGGGGAGGMIVASNQTIAVGTYSIVIGAGATATLYAGNVGTDTTAFGDTCDGGGGSGAYLIAASVAGGSGGGARGTIGEPGGAATQGNPTTLSGTGYGFAGGSSSINHSGGGGGGAGGLGVNADTTATQGGGGLGLDNLYRTGSNVTYAGGGEGGTYSGSRSTTHTGLAGGGGIGSAGNEATPPTAGVENKGAGGGGRGGNTAANVTPGGNGGKGIVVIRYAA